MPPYFTVVIPSYRRARLLAYTLRGLTKQEFKDFDTVVVVKPSNDGTEEMVRASGAELVVQDGGNVLDALSLGFAHARGRVTAIADSDTYAYPDWLRRLSEAYELRPDAGGIAGLTIECSMQNDGRVVPLPTRFTGVSLSKGVSRGKMMRNLIKPESATDALTRLSPSLSAAIYGSDHSQGSVLSISRAGLPVVDRSKYEKELGPSSGRTVVLPSDLGQGANLSLRTDLARRIGAPIELRSSNPAYFEQVIAARIRKAGYRTYFTPNAAVYHIVSGSGIARDRWGNPSFGFQIKCGRDSALSFFLMRSSSVATRLSAYLLRSILLETLQPIVIGAIVGNVALLLYPAGFLKGTIEGLTRNFA